MNKQIRESSEVFGHGFANKAITTISPLVHYSRNFASFVEKIFQNLTIYNQNAQDTSITVHIDWTCPFLRHHLYTCYSAIGTCTEIYIGYGSTK